MADRTFHFTMGSIPHHWMLAAGNAASLGEFYDVHVRSIRQDDSYTHAAPKTQHALEQGAKYIDENHTQPNYSKASSLIRAAPTTKRETAENVRPGGKVGYRRGEEHNATMKYGYKQDYINRPNYSSKPDKGAYYEE